MTHQTARLILAMAIVLMAGAAQAADFKTYPGAMCQPGELTNASNIEYRFTGEVFNTSTEFSVLVVCPIVRDSVFTPPGDLRAVFVRFSKPNDIPATCTLFSRDQFGTSGFMDTRFTSGVGNVVMGFPALSGVHIGYYVLSCIVPHAQDDRPSGIVSYLVVEGE